MTEFVPEIDSDIPLPASATDAFPPLSVQAELDMRAKTIKLLADLTGAPLTLSDESQSQAEELAKQMITNPAMRPDYASYPNDTLAYLAGMVAQMNCMVVDDLADLKLYVVNKLIELVERTDNDKNRLTALRQLGEVAGVDAYMRRSEMTVQIKPIAQIEQELKSVIDSLEVTVSEPTALPATQDASP